MNYTAEQVMNGLVNYADNEVMSKLPTSGKWIAGTMMGIATTKTGHLIDSLRDNTIVNMLGIIDENGLIDVDTLIEAMKLSADKYGKIMIDIPLVGKLGFTSDDVIKLRTFIV